MRKRCWALKPDQLGLRVICGGGESGFEQPAFQKKCEAAFGTPHVYDWASASDAHPNVFGSIAGTARASIT